MPFLLETTRDDRTLVYLDKRHVGVIIDRGLTGPKEKRGRHVNVITASRNTFVGSFQDALTAIRDDLKLESAPEAKAS